MGQSAGCTSAFKQCACRDLSKTRCSRAAAHRHSHRAAGTWGTTLVGMGLGKRRPVARPARRSGPQSRRSSKRIHFFFSGPQAANVSYARRAVQSHRNLAAPMALSSTGCASIIAAGGDGVKRRREPAGRGGKRGLGRVRVRHDHVKDRQPAAVALRGGAGHNGRGRRVPLLKGSATSKSPQRALLESSGTHCRTRVMLQPCSIAA